MNPVIITAQFVLGNGSVTVSVFNLSVSYQHFFSPVNPQPWTLALAPGPYIVSVAGTCPAGGSVSVDISGITNSAPATPWLFNTPGNFIQSNNVTV